MLATIKEKMHFCKDLLLRKFPSKDHEMQWADIEMAHCYRTLIFQAITIVFTVSKTLQSEMHWQTTAVYLDQVSTVEQDKDNRFELKYASASDVYTFVKVSLIVTDCFRLLLLVLAVRHKRLSKLFIYVHTFWFVLSTFLPQEESVRARPVVMWALIISLLNYFQFCVALGASIIMAFSHYLARSLLFEESFSFGLFARDVCQLISLLVLLHCIITWVALKYIDKEVSLKAKNKLLNNLEEGVMIVKDDTQELCLLNSAAKKHLDY